MTASTVAELSAVMIPALDILSSVPQVGDISSVPALSVHVEREGKAIQCVGLIDTGAEMSFLDQSLFQSISESELGGEEVSIRLSLNAHRAKVFRMTVALADQQSKRQLLFKDVPVAVLPLPRRLFVIGRRGILEWLRVELDFPRQSISLKDSRADVEGYPHLSESFPGLSTAERFMKEGETTAGVLSLSWDMERYLDQLGLRDSSVATAFAQIPQRNRSLRSKLLAVTNQNGSTDLVSDIELFLRARDLAAHGQSSELKQMDGQAILDSAERILSHLA